MNDSLVYNYSPTSNSEYFNSVIPNHNLNPAPETLFSSRELDAAKISLPENINFIKTVIQTELEVTLTDPNHKVVQLIPPPEATLANEVSAKSQTQVVQFPRQPETQTQESLINTNQAADSQTPTAKEIPHIKLPEVTTDIKISAVRGRIAQIREEARQKESPQNYQKPGMTDREKMVKQGWELFGRRKLSNAASPPPLKHLSYHSRENRSFNQLLKIHLQRQGKKTDLYSRSETAPDQNIGSQRAA